MDYLNKEKADDAETRLAAWQDYPGICVAPDTSNMTIVIPMMSLHIESCYVPPENVGGHIAAMLREKGLEDSPFVLYLPQWGDAARSVDVVEYLEAIQNALGYRKITQLLDAHESGLVTYVYIVE